MGQGRASGKSRAADAARAAVSSPLLDVGIERATGIVWNITGPEDMKLHEVGFVGPVCYQDHDCDVPRWCCQAPSAQSACIATMLSEYHKQLGSRTQRLCANMTSGEPSG